MSRRFETGEKVGWPRYKRQEPAVPKRLILGYPQLAFFLVRPEEGPTEPLAYRGRVFEIEILGSGLGVVRHTIEDSRDGSSVPVESTFSPQGLWQREGSQQVQLDQGALQGGYFLPYPTQPSGSELP